LLTISIVNLSSFNTDCIWIPYFDQSGCRVGVECDLFSDKVIIDNNFLTSNKIRDYICVSDTVIQPYNKASQSGITPVAYFYDKPLVVSNIKGLKETIIKDQSGEVFDETVVNLATAIKNCLNPESNRNYSNNIYKSKRKYSWSKFVKKLLGLKNW